MMTFEELQHSWKAQPVAEPESVAAMEERFMKKWKKQQRGVLWSNIGVTLGFAGASIVMVWVYNAFHKGRSLFFSGSIFFMLLLMAVYLVILWRGISLRRKPASLPGSEYVSHYIKLLRLRRRTITTYQLVYVVLLWLALMCYYYDVLAGASVPHKLWVYGTTTIYIASVYFIKRFTSGRKQLVRLNELINSLEEMN